MRFLIPPKEASASSNKSLSREPAVIDIDKLFALSYCYYKQGAVENVQIYFSLDGSEDGTYTWFFHDENVEQGRIFYNKLLVALNAKTISNI